MRWWLLLGLCGCDAVFGIRALPPPDAGPSPDAPPAQGRWAQLAVGERHACGIDTAGQLSCWGDVAETGPGGASLVPVVVPSPEAAPWTQVAAGGIHTCGITAGHVYCWGDDVAGESTGSGAPSIAMPARVPLPALAGPTVDQVSAGSLHTCAIVGGQLWCWGVMWQAPGSSPAPTQIAPNKTDWATVSAGVEHSCAVDQGGDVLCWGQNEHGQSAPGVATTTVAVPAQISLPDKAFAVSAGNATSCALLGTAPTGSVWCWGANDLIQAGTAAITAPVQVLPASDWTAVRVGTRGVCAIHGGKALCWGDVQHGGLGDGVWTEAIGPTKVVNTIAADDLVLALSPENGESGCVRSNGNASCWGDNAGGQLGTPGTLHTMPVTVAGHWQAVAAGGHHTCARDGSGAMWCWGANDAGQVTGTPGADQPSPTPASSTAQAMVVGAGSTCALVGTAVSCWGTNSGGQLGDTDRMAHQAMTIGSGASTLIGGGNGACAIDGVGQECWGTIADSVVAPPQRLGGSIPTLDEVGFGAYAACGISGGNRVCWGINANGDLGNGSSDPVVFAPQTFSGEGTYQAIALTSDHACALVDGTSAGSGAVSCWGQNAELQSAAGSAADIVKPTVLTDGANPIANCTAVAVSDVASCAVCGGGVACWGLATMGRLGRGANDIAAHTIGPVVTPMVTGAWLDVALGDDHGCAVAADGTLACWGLSARGEIGDGTHGSAVPVPVPGPP